MIAKFGRFTFDSGRRLLLDGDRGVTVPPKAFDLLELLIRQAPNVVTKETIAATVWPNEAPSDASLAMAVTELRKALGETGDHPQFIRTLHRRGYAFTTDVGRDFSRGEPTDVGRSFSSGSVAGAEAPAYTTEAPAYSPGKPGSKFWLVMGEKTLPLPPGDTVAGRDPASAIWLDRPSVSRSHARFTVEETSAWVEDLGSLNGTLVGGTRITRRVRLHPGDTIAIGEVTLTLGSSHTAATTPTRPLRKP